MTISGDDEDPCSIWNRLRDLGLDVLVSALEDDTNTARNNLVSSISLPTLKYGYAKSPLSWEQLQDIILVQGNFAKLSRSVEQQRDYQIFRYCLQQQYRSVLDYLLISKFGFEKQQQAQEQQQEQEQEQGTRWKAYPSLQDSTVTRTILVPNDFPYFMAKGIVHFILWKTKAVLTREEIETAKQELCSQLPVMDTLHWINPPHLQSLPDIDHAHILCRLSDETATYNEP